MKKMIKNGLVAAALMCAVVVSASGTELPVKVAVSGEKSIGLFINEISEKIWISLRDEDGQVIYSKTLKGQKNYAVEYDLRNLPDGSYMVEFEDANLRKRVHLVIVEGKVAISNPVAQVVKK
ncbi:MAG TPA: hypothetical protein PKJ63_08615 [Cyclobacteriaceae bacterium]|nr:hypothetical protein [Cyclobacteriaceae bacterium]